MNKELSQLNIYSVYYVYTTHAVHVTIERNLSILWSPYDRQIHGKNGGIQIDLYSYIIIVIPLLDYYQIVSCATIIQDTHLITSTLAQNKTKFGLWKLKKFF